MQMAQILAQQTCVMFLLMGCGYVLFRAKLITPEGSKTLANLLVWLVIPSVLIQSFHGKYSPQNVRMLLGSAAVGLALLLLSMAIALLVFRRAPIDNFAAAFSNAGFMGIPLVSAALGEQGVFYITAYMAFLNVLQWTYGTRVLTGQKSKASLKSLLLSPIVVGVAIGLVLFFGNITLPVIADRTLGFLAGINTPLAMIILGVYLAQSDFKSLFTSPQLYKMSAVRLILIPLAVMGVLWLLPLDAAMKTALMIVCAAPVGANVAVYSQINHLDYAYACKTVTLSTLLSIFTLPLLAGLSAFLW